MSGARPFSPRYLFRLALGAIFLWAAVSKIGDISGFAGDIHNYHMLPIALENLFAMTLVWVELVGGLALVFNVAPRSGTIILGGLLGVFLVAIAQAVFRGLDIDCGCFGTSDAARVGWIAIGRDVLFLALAWFGYPRR